MWHPRSSKEGGFVQVVERNYKFCSFCKTPASSLVMRYLLRKSRESLRMSERQWQLGDDDGDVNVNNTNLLPNYSHLHSCIWFVQCSNHWWLINLEARKHYEVTWTVTQLKQLNCFTANHFSMDRYLNLVVLKFVCLLVATSVVCCFCPHLLLLLSN